MRITLRPEKTKRYGVPFSPFGLNAQDAQRRDRCRRPRSWLGFLGVGEGVRDRATGEAEGETLLLKLRGCVGKKLS